MSDLNEDGLVNAMKQLLSFESIKPLEEVEPGKYRQLKRECEAILRAYFGGCEMGNYFDELLGIKGKSL